MVARVEGEVLTSGELKKQLGSDTTMEQQRLYVQSWLDRELLYQGARNEKMHRDPVYVNKLLEGERNLLSMAYLNRIVDIEEQEVTDEEVLQFFDENRSLYIRDDDVIRFAVFSLKTVTDAWNVRKGLTAKNFYSSSRRYSKTPTVAENKIAYVKKSSLSPELQKTLFSIKEGGITTPIRVGKSVNLYLIIEKGKLGEQASLAEVSSQVRNLLITTNYQVQIDSAMVKLRSKSNYTYNREYFETIGDNQVSLRGNENE